LGEVDGLVFAQNTLALLHPVPESTSLRTELVKAWVTLMGVTPEPLKLNELQELMRIDAAKSTGSSGFYRYPVTKMVSQAEVTHKTMPSA
jgi:hypothetical protein